MNGTVGIREEDAMIVGEREHVVLGGRGRAEPVSVRADVRAAVREA